MAVAPRRTDTASHGDRGIEYAIDIIGLSKSFQRHTLARGSYSTLKSSLLALLAKKQGAEARQQQVTQVLKDVTLRIPRGASVGIIGRNGSGKSTFLKLLTGIYKPDAGSVRVHGRVAALIELGAGFHPDFTGRENLMLGGIMHGLTRRQIEERFDQIVSFAELEEVIDDPVRTYSSGMFMRLGFSLAVHTDPDILLVDEVLAVGDAAFVNKCKEQIARLRREGRTLFLVSHDLDAIERWCDEVLWIHAGEVRDRGEPRRVIDHYREFVERGEEELLLGQQASLEEPPVAVEQGAHEDEGRREGPQRWGSREIELVSIRLLDATGEERRVFHPNDGMVVEFEYRMNEPREDVVFGIGLQRSDGLMVHGSNTHLERVQLPQLGRNGIVRYEVARTGLLDGSYSLDLAVHREDGYPYDYRKGELQFAVRSDRAQIGVFEPPHRWVVTPKREGGE